MLYWRNQHKGDSYENKDKFQNDTGIQAVPGKLAYKAFERSVDDSKTGKDILLIQKIYNGKPIKLGYIGYST